MSIEETHAHELNAFVEYLFTTYNRYENYSLTSTFQSLK